MAECILIEETVSFKLDRIQRKGITSVILCKEQVKFVEAETGQTRVLYENLKDFFAKGSGRRGLQVEWTYIGGPLGDTPRRRMQLQDVKMGVKVHGPVVHDLLKFFGEGLRLKFILSQSEIDIPSRPNGPDSEAVESGEISYDTDPTRNQHHFFNSNMLVPDKWRKHWSLQSGTTFSAVLTIKMSGDVILKEIPTSLHSYSLDEAPPQQSFSMKDLLIHMEKDAVILPKDNSFRFECHQALLKACSPKFVELIDRLRKDGNVVSIEIDMTKEGVAEFLTFIEDGTLSLAKKELSVALELLSFSSLYSIEKLTFAGVHAVLQYREMDAKNAIELFKFAVHPSSRSERLERKSMEMVKRIGGFFCSEAFISLVTNDNERAALLQRRFNKYFRV